MEEPVTKKQLIDAIRVERARWEMLLLRVGAGRMSLPVCGEGRSVAELVRDLHEREHWLVGRLASVSASLPDRHFLRATTCAHEDVVEASSAAFNEILRLLVSLSEPDLFSRDRFAWLHGRTLAEVVTACTTCYYREHDAPLRSWLSQPVAQAV